MFVAVSEKALERDCGPWWSHSRGDTKSSSWADCGAVPLIYTPRGSTPGHTPGLLLCCRAATSEGFAVCADGANPNQMSTAALVLLLPSQKQAPSLPAVSHKLCFEGDAAGSNEQQCLSLYSVVLALGSHMQDIFVIHFLLYMPSGTECLWKMISCRWG